MYIKLQDIYWDRVVVCLHMLKLGQWMNGLGRQHSSVGFFVLVHLCERCLLYACDVISLVMTGNNCM